MKFNVQDSGFEEHDRVIYNLSKFVELCVRANPNIVELLFVPEEFTTFSTKKWEQIRRNASLFLSKKVKYTFTGYAFSQLNALRRHREWFLNPPLKKPEREDFGLTSVPTVSMAWLNSLKDSINYSLLRPEIVDEVSREREYRDAKKKWDNYIQWKTTRNPKRRGTEEAYGYDTKYASHIFRLMLEGKELLLEERITFPLREAEFVLAVKRGEFTYDQIENMASELEASFEIWYEESNLPKSPNINAIKDLYYSLILE
jgi:hypothetical protein